MSMTSTPPLISSACGNTTGLVLCHRVVLASRVARLGGGRAGPAGWPGCGSHWWRRASSCPWFRASRPRPHAVGCYRCVAGGWMGVFGWWGVGDVTIVLWVVSGLAGVVVLLAVLGSWRW